MNDGTSTGKARKVGPAARSAVLVGLLAVAGCPCRGPEPPPTPPPPPVHPFCLQASDRLNWYDGESHTLYVRVFQLSVPDGFAQTDVAQLLEPKAPIPGVVGTPIGRTVHPKTTVALELTEAPGAELIGVVAAYYQLTGNGKAAFPIGAQLADGCLHLGANAIETPQVVGAE